MSMYLTSIVQNEYCDNIYFDKRRIAFRSKHPSEIQYPQSNQLIVLFIFSFILSLPCFCPDLGKIDHGLIRNRDP